LSSRRKAFLPVAADHFLIRHHELDRLVAGRDGDRIHDLLGKHQTATGRCDFLVGEKAIVERPAPAQAIAATVEAQGGRHHQVDLPERDRDPRHRVAQPPGARGEARLQRRDLHGDHVALLPGDLRHRHGLAELPGLEDGLGGIDLVRQGQKQHHDRGVLKLVRRDQVPARPAALFFPLFRRDRQQAVAQVATQLNLVHRLAPGLHRFSDVSAWCHYLPRIATSVNGA
jgi:hypothetical protein